MDSFKKLLAGNENLSAQKAVDLYRERFSTKGMFENQVYTGIEEMLQALRAEDYRLFIATSKPQVYSVKIIEHFGLTKYFESVYGSELDGTRTDKSDLIRHILESEGISPTHTLMIGDRKYDLIGAKKNNVRPVGISWGYGDIFELESENPAAIFHHPQELTGYLLSQQVL